MKKLSFTHSQFVTSSFAAETLPKLCTPHGNPMLEIACVGRSNVGKSSLINHLLGKKLAKTSSIPGKTQLINFFSVDEQVALVDLPGYGYAKVPKQVKEKWSIHIDQYLNHRSTLQLILFLMDSRRAPTEEDCAFVNWAALHKKPLLLIFTKADKINESEKQKNALTSLETLKEFMPFISDHFLHYSIVDSRARIGLIKKINDLLILG